MTMLTIRRLDASLKERLRLRAARHGHSMEEEVRRILAAACEAEEQEENLATIALELFGREHGVELQLPQREAGREPPHFE